MEERWLVVGLGNPGPRYEGTRHNIGFALVDELAHALGLNWKEEKRLSSLVAKGVTENGHSVLLLKPQTYMNESGRSVRKVLDYYNENANTLLVIVDDIALSFGEARLKPKGSAGGHNGLKSIQAHIGTQDYLRLRMGVGDRERGCLSDHVLGRFSRDEAEAMPLFMRKGLELVKKIIEGEDVHALMKQANTRPKPQRPGGKPSPASTPPAPQVEGGETTGPAVDKASRSREVGDGS